MRDYSGVTAVASVVLVAMAPAAALVHRVSLVVAEVPLPVWWSSL